MYILYVILVIIVLLLLIAAVLPKKIEISASATIVAPKDVVWEYVKLFKNQKEYSVRVMKDPNVQLTYGGVDGTIGAKQERDSTDKNVGKGEQEMTHIDEGKSYDVELRFERPMKATNYAKNVLIDNGDGTTTITNSFWGKTPRPMNIINLVVVPGLKKDMQQNMDNLKVILENK